MLVGKFLAFYYYIICLQVIVRHKHKLTQKHMYYKRIRKVIEEDEFVDAIVSNLPWGVKTGHNQSVNDLQNLYVSLLLLIIYRTFQIIQFNPLIHFHYVCMLINLSLIILSPNIPTGNIPTLFLLQIEKRWPYCNASSSRLTNDSNSS